jgi:hypothetical protein
VKYNTFRNLLFVGGLGLGGLGLWQCSRCEPGGDEQDASARAASGTIDARTPDAAAGGPVEAYLLSKLGRTAGTDKIKDGLGAGSPKVNVYAEGGIWARAKVDLDRDEKWDEKWSLVDGVVQREVSPSDDDNYGAPQTWTDGAWVDPNAPAASPPEPLAAPLATPTPAGTDNPLDAGGEVERAMASAQRRPVQDKIKDTTKGLSFKINIYSDDGARWNRAKVDLDRDDKWDETWTFGVDGSIEKQVAPADDENYTQRWSFADGGWREIG